MVPTFYHLLSFLTVCHFDMLHYGLWDFGKVIQVNMELREEFMGNRHGRPG